MAQQQQKAKKHLENTEAFLEKKGMRSLSPSKEVMLEDSLNDRQGMSLNLKSTKTIEEDEESV